MDAKKAHRHCERVIAGLLRAIKEKEPLERIGQWQRRLDRAWGFCRRAHKVGLFGERYAGFSGAMEGLPSDLATHHEHHRLGAPKR